MFSLSSLHKSTKLRLTELAQHFRDNGYKYYDLDENKFIFLQDLVVCYRTKNGKICPQTSKCINTRESKIWISAISKEIPHQNCSPLIQEKSIIFKSINGDVFLNREQVEELYLSKKLIIPIDDYERNLLLITSDDLQYFYML